MIQQDFIILFLLIIIGVLFFRELQRQRQERRSNTLCDSKKVEAVINTQMKQMEFMTSLDGRVDKLGQVVVLVVKILEAENRNRQGQERGVKE